MVVLIAEAPLSRGAFYVHDFFEKVSWFVFELFTEYRESGGCHN